MVPIPGLHTLTATVLGIPSCQEGMCGLKPAQAVALFKVGFITCPGFILYVGLSHIYASSTLVWLAQEDITLY